MARLATRSRKPGPVDSVIQSSLEQKEKVLAGDAFLARRAFKEIAKLSFENKVDPFDLLLFAKLLAITGQGLAATHGITMLSGRLSSALLNRTGRIVAPVSLEQKFCSFAAAQTAHRISIPSQSFLPPV